MRKSKYTGSFSWSGKSFNRSQNPRWPQKQIVTPVKPRIYTVIKWCLFKLMYIILVQREKKKEKIKTLTKNIYIYFIISPYFIRNKSSSFSLKYLSSSQFLTTRNLHYSFKEEIIEAYTIYKKKLCKILNWNPFSIFQCRVIFMNYVVIQLSQIYLATFFFT